MKTLWNDDSRHRLWQRLERLTPDTPARWGRMNASEMLAHVLEGMRVGLGELPTKPRVSMFSRWPLKYLFIYWISFPKGAPAPRELVTRGKSSDWDASRGHLRDCLERFAQRDPRNGWPDHPVFGKLSGRAWGALGWRHLDHHLRQFGL